MRITSLYIKNFRTIRLLNIEDIENAMILVGRNSTGKTNVLNAILAVSGKYEVKPEDFFDPQMSIEIGVRLEITDADLQVLNRNGIVSKYKNYDMWYKDFCNRLPSYADGILSFSFIVSNEMKVRYYDGIKKHNPSIPEVFPKIHFIDSQRRVEEIQADILLAQEQNALSSIINSVCMFDSAKNCNNCFNCIPVIEKKSPSEMTIHDTAKLLEYKLMQLTMDSFLEKLNKCYTRNSGRYQNVEFTMNFSMSDFFSVNTIMIKRDKRPDGTVAQMSAGSKSIYILSLLEAYIDSSNFIPSIIMMEDPEIYLHPQLQKQASEILYKLSKKNQVFFSTHSPNLIFNFNSKQIKQVRLDEEFNTCIAENVSIDMILNDLGYNANDFMNVSFVFIVEGKQDGTRLPMLLRKYYSEIVDESGNLKRISIITTNSCTNIKTYANLKYINQLYLKDQFLMIRDGDGKKPEQLVKQLCSYYKERAQQDIGNLPRVQPKNVLVLKYYSFENYFLDPKVMAKIGVIKSEEDFYNILYDKFKSYLFKLSSVKKMREATKIVIRTKDDIKKNIETIKIYVRGHNLFDIFYGRFHGEEENEILMRYIDAAPREDFADILDAIDSFVYFDSKKSEEKIIEDPGPKIYRDKHKKRKRK